MIDRNGPRWHRDAIIYRLDVKSFFDANNDGVGDAGGLPENSITSRISARDYKIRSRGARGRRYCALTGRMVRDYWRDPPDRAVFA
ncbi:MAG: hypothetical protein ACR2KT_15475 [Methylocella sp.]|nr:MAG: hypothetical protein DLM68_06725 [Hyphomicrobiales bacterium]